MNRSGENRTPWRCSVSRLHRSRLFHYQDRRENVVQNWIATLTFSPVRWSIYQSLKSSTGLRMTMYVCEYPFALLLFLLEINPNFSTSSMITSVWRSFLASISWINSSRSCGTIMSTALPTRTGDVQKFTYKYEEKLGIKWVYPSWNSWFYHIQRIILLTNPIVGVILLQIFEKCQLLSDFWHDSQYFELLLTRVECIINAVTRYVIFYPLW